MDNCSIHHVAHVTRLLQEIGVLVQWLPPYLPDFNPLEEAFSKVKLMQQSVLMIHGMHCKQWCQYCQVFASLISIAFITKWIENSAMYK